MDYLAGELLLIDKPVGWTSFDVCAKLRGALRHALGVKKVKIGHSGTLDPLATGLLLLATGKKTKALHELQGLDKGYDGTIKLGATTASYDAELPEENVCTIEHITLDHAREQAKHLTGAIAQVPPIYSAIKRDGVPAYKVARAKGEIKMEPRPVVIREFTLGDLTDGELQFSSLVSKGTYIRSLAHDLGQLLGCGAYLSSLRRTSIGDFHIDDAYTMDEMLAIIRNPETNK